MRIKAQSVLVVFTLCSPDSLVFLKNSFLTDRFLYGGSSLMVEYGPVAPMKRVRFPSTALKYTWRYKKWKAIKE